jgi:hypothetical protein
MQGWIGVDLDGTLAQYDGWQHWCHIGDPIPVMVARVKRWLVAGLQVKVVTARVGENTAAVGLIQDWLEQRAGLPRLEVTANKDFQMIELWDDRVVQVESNTGRQIGSRSVADGAVELVEDPARIAKKMSEICEHTNITISPDEGRACYIAHCPDCHCGWCISKLRLFALGLEEASGIKQKSHVEEREDG